MSGHALTVDTRAGSVASSLSRVQAVPWTVQAAVAASVLCVVGIYLDMSWHKTVGRDTFWTLAHIIMQTGAVIAALSSAFMIFRITFAGDALARQASVKVLGFRGALGGFICAWGGAAMVASAPFDDWWHRAYGLDVRIISPPHTLLILGIVATMWGCEILILGAMNRAEGPLRARLNQLLLFGGGLIAIIQLVFVLQFTSRVFMHSAICYFMIAVSVPLVLECVARASGYRWARTAITAAYSGMILLMIWVFPLFPAQPKLGPVYRSVTHLVPADFPILLIVPAFFLDLIWPRMKDSRGLQALVGGVGFLGMLVAVQWPFADFLMSPASRNWIFATQNTVYFMPPTADIVRNVFTQHEATRTAFWTWAFSAVLASVISTWLGITAGNWMRRVRR